MTWCSTFLYVYSFAIVTFALDKGRQWTPKHEMNENHFSNISILKFSGNFVGVNLKLDSISLTIVSKTMMTKRFFIQTNLIKTDDESSFFLGESFFHSFPIFLEMKTDFTVYLKKDTEPVKMKFSYKKGSSGKNQTLTSWFSYPWTGRTFSYVSLMSLIITFACIECFNQLSFFIYRYLFFIKK